MTLGGPQHADGPTARRRGDARGPDARRRRRRSRRDRGAERPATRRPSTARSRRRDRTRTEPERRSNRRSRGPPHERLREVPPPLRPKSARARMTLIEHLEELRHRLIICIIAVAAGAVVGWFLYEPVLRPDPEPVLRLLARRPTRSSATNGSCSLFFNGPFGATDREAQDRRASSGSWSRCPCCSISCGRSSCPASPNKEKKMAIPFVGSSVVLFALGRGVRLRHACRRR